MKSLKRISLAATFCAAMVATSAPSWATLYTFTFSGADLMKYTSNGPLEYDGGKKINDIKSWENLVDFEDCFKNLKLTSFHLWGFGGDDALAWGETIEYTNWVGTPATATKGWESFTHSDSYTDDNTVLAFGTPEGYSNGLTFGASDLGDYEFSFTLDLDSTASYWLGDNKDQIAFWFGGFMVDANDKEAARLQGNMLLTGVASVPEPTTMLLFGTGIMGLAFGARRRNR